MIDYQEAYEKARIELASLRDQLKAYEAMEAGDIPQACTWLQSKAFRQGKALDRLNRRVLNQRLQLRTLNELGRGLTPEEYREARAKVTNEQVLARLEPELVG